MDHPTLKTLNDYHDGGVSPDQGLLIEEHLDECPECAGQYAQLLSKIRAGKDGAGVDSPPRPLALPGELANALRQLGASGQTRRSSLAMDSPTIDGYEFVDEIGRGGMGVVYKAVKLDSRQVVAIKVIAAGEFATTEEIERFHREADAVAGIADTEVKVVRVFEHGEFRGLHFISMELIHGGPLSKRLSDVVRSPAEAARIVADVAESVDRLHKSGIIHRDIKPANILLQPFPGEPVDQCSLARCVPLLTDFGLVKKVGESALTQAGQIVGTPEFMAPEMIRSSNEATTAADVYSLGSTLYACLVGVSPFKAATPFDTLKRVETDYPDSIVRLNREVPLSLQWICFKALEKDPARRYTSAAEMASDLRRALAKDPKDPVKVGPLPNWIRVSRFVEMNKRLTVAIGFVVILSLAIACVCVQQLFVISERAEQETDRRIAAEKLAGAESEARQKAEALTDAERQRRQAEYKRAEAEKLAAHTALVTSARERARRGDWGGALSDYNRVVEDGSPESLRLRIERLVAFFALNNIPKLVEELDELEHMQVGDMAAQVKLIRAAWLLCDVTRQEEGRMLAREALKNGQHLFSKADEAFAEALAAERVGQSIAALRKAVDRDPMHYLSASSLVVALAAVGDLEEARRQARFVRGVFPFSPAPDIAEALVALIEDDPVMLKKKLAMAAEKVPVDRQREFASTEKYLLLVNELQKISTRMSSSDNELAFLVDMLRAGVLLAKIQQTGKLPNREPLGLPVPTVSLFHRRYAEVFATYAEVTPLARQFLADEKLLPRLKTLNDDYPDSGLLLLTSIVHFKLSVDPVNVGDIPEARKHLEEAADLSSRATKAPNLLPKSSIQYLARCLGVTSDLAVLKFVPQGDSNIQRVRANLHALISEGEKWPKLRHSFLVKYVEVTTAPLLRRQCGEWKLDDARGKAAYDRRRQELATLARILLDDWAISEPNNPVIPRLRIDLTRWQDSSGILEDMKVIPPKE